MNWYHKISQVLQSPQWGQKDNKNLPTRNWFTTQLNNTLLQCKRISDTGESLVLIALRKPGRFLLYIKCLIIFDFYSMIFYFDVRTISTSTIPYVLSTNVMQKWRLGAIYCHIPQLTVLQKSVLLSFCTTPVKHCIWDEILFGYLNV